MLLKIFVRHLKKIAKFVRVHRFSQPYWVEITTKEPKCIYYFGPFNSRTEAKRMQHGYIEDLIEEKAIGINVKIKRCLPTNLTITEDTLEVPEITNQTSFL